MLNQKRRPHISDAAYLQVGGYWLVDFTLTIPGEPRQTRRYCCSSVKGHPTKEQATECFRTTHRHLTGREA